MNKDNKKYCDIKFCGKEILPNEPVGIVRHVQSNAEVHHICFRHDLNKAKKLSKYCNKFEKNDFIKMFDEMSK